MDGILLINKPQGWTSFDVVKKLKGVTKQRKIGHAGTLDPMATGVLPIMLGKATPLCDRLPNPEKRYIGKVQLGKTTDTQDITGTVIEEREFSHVTRDDILSKLDNFRGDIQQIPPMYSAVWSDGRRLYDLARQGIEVERKARNTTIYALELLEFNEDGSFTLDITCSKGTYIRTIADDLGKLLGTGATLTYLERTVSSGFKLEDCITLEKAIELGSEGIGEYVKPSHTAFSYPKLMIGEWQKKMLLNGVRLSVKKLGNPNEGNYTVWFGEEFLGLGTVVEEELRLKQL